MYEEEIFYYPGYKKAKAASISLPLFIKDFNFSGTLTKIDYSKGTNIIPNTVNVFICNPEIKY